MLQIDIIEKCKRNNRKAQLQLYNNYCNGMFIVAKRYLKNDAEAEDAVQEAFIKAFTKLGQFNSDVSFGAWLKRIVINKCLDVLKAKKAQLITLEENHMTIVDGSNDDEWLVDDSVTIHDVINAINNLSDKYKYVVLLYLIEGYDHNEIAGILQISTTASRTQLSRGKRKLQQMLTPKYHGSKH